MTTSTKFTHKLTLKQPGERNRFKQGLFSLAGVTWEEKAEQYCEYRLDGKLSDKASWLRAKQFTNGTLYLEAASEELLLAMANLVSGGGASVGTIQTQIVAVSPTAGASKSSGSKSGGAKPSGLLDITGTYIGTDESGKGDYFGPLVIAGVLVTDETVPKLAALGVMDSKKLTPKDITELARQIMEVVGEEAVAVVEMGPKKYNELYDKFKSSGKNLNHLLAWGHARVIENLLGGHPDCLQAVADQFGSEHYIKSQLQEKGKQIKLYQTPRAEANIGVAAASIVARHKFVSKMNRLSNEFGVMLPFGASPQVKVAARKFIQAHGRENLEQVAKLHFKTTQEL